MRSLRSVGRQKRQSGQVMVLVAVALLAMIASVALILLAGSVEWQKNQLQELTDSAALDSALKIGAGCNAAKANAVITEADNFLATRRTRTGALAITAGTCATPYKGQDTFAGGLTSIINYPYRAHEQQVEVILTLALPISFGTNVGTTNTTVVRRAVAQQLEGSVPAISATTLTCASGQVNVAGSVVAQNLIVRTGTCALYAHGRLDASGSYSDLGDVSVYADGQSWSAAGTCVAGSNSGASNAICSDGHELTGHTAPACGAAATSFLSAGDKAINPNPCAAGTGPQPVAPVRTSLPPEPNLDPVAVATLQGTGGAACTAGALLPNIVIGGVTVATGLGPAPVRDITTGFYHFKPSCYGYLNANAVTAGISNLQTGAESAKTSPTVTASLPAASQAGTLLVATIRSGASVTAFTAPANWVLATTRNQVGASHTDIWYYPNNPGGIVSAAFGVPNASVAQMTEWRNVATTNPLDASGTSTSTTVSTSTATTMANDLVITDFGPAVLSPQTYTRGAGWTGLVSDMPNGFASEYRLNLPAAVASETVTVTNATTWSAGIAAFKPGTGAVLDPGFYYFNGSGFAGGGGICLNGATLLARDVTLEFVNQAGFSSGTCAPGGGVACTGACQFGSQPCSLLVCPPNLTADSPNNLTWFAAPCSAAPAAADAASCPGSAWCTAGDRSCSEQLIWAPSGNTGQIAITGSVANAWLLGSIAWPGTCTIADNGTSTLAGTISCGALSLSAVAGAGITVGSDAGINPALVEAVLIE
ncbi:MAG: hypothetical protein M3082_17930 [Candidatus Dormibacteraeota bacterium]|nr:hypothetical protein [Candidatus Dormibacteraeota bacterium]